MKWYLIPLRVKKKYFQGKLAIYTVFILNSMPGILSLRNVQKGRCVCQNIEFDRNNRFLWKLNELDGNLAVFSITTLKLSPLYPPSPSITPPPPDTHTQSKDGQIEIKQTFPFYTKQPFYNGGQTDKFDTKFSPNHSKALHHKGLFLRTTNDMLTVLFYSVTLVILDCNLTVVTHPLGDHQSPTQFIL